LHKNLKYDTKNKQLVLNFFTPQSVFTGGWGTKFKCFRIFRASNHPKQSNLYSNNQIYIQTVIFEFKPTNQEVTHRYRPPALVTGSNAGAIYQAVATGPAPTRTLPPAPAGLKPYHPLSPPRHLLWALPPRLRAVAPTNIGTSLIDTYMVPHSLCRPASRNI
jgi:hypothetical protein